MSLTLREWRRIKEISQQSMADKLNIHVGTYQHWEQDPGRIPFGKAVEIARIFQVELDDIRFSTKELVS